MMRVFVSEEGFETQVSLQLLSKRQNKLADDAEDFVESGATGHDVEHSILKHGTHTAGNCSFFYFLCRENMVVCFEKPADFAGHDKLFTNSNLTLEAIWVFG